MGMFSSFTLTCTISGRRRSRRNTLSPTSRLDTSMVISGGMSLPRHRTSKCFDTFHGNPPRFTPGLASSPSVRTGTFTLTLVFGAQGMKLTFSTRFVDGSSISCFATTGSFLPLSGKFSSSTLEPTPTWPCFRTSRSMSLDANDSSSPDSSPGRKNTPGTMPRRFKWRHTVLPAPSRANTSRTSPLSSSASDDEEDARSVRVSAAPRVGHASRGALTQPATARARGAIARSPERNMIA
mmetsp:Transcript_6692/g.28510  ORF Transcript_6692/g.28510 Transcript_6692/m.28510 type:complete len:238 (-) Transcript_6692:14-727(-)